MKPVHVVGGGLAGLVLGIGLKWGPAGGVPRPDDRVVRG